MFFVVITCSELDSGLYNHIYIVPISYRDVFVVKPRLCDTYWRIAKKQRTVTSLTNDGVHQSIKQDPHPPATYKYFFYYCIEAYLFLALINYALELENTRDLFLGEYACDIGLLF